MSRYADFAEQAAELTNKQLAEKIGALSAVREKDLRRIMKLKSDRVDFVELMTLVEEQTSDAEKETALIEDINQYAPVIVKALKFFI